MFLSGLDFVVTTWKYCEKIVSQKSFQDNSSWSKIFFQNYKSILAVVSDFNICPGKRLCKVVVADFLC